jgi:hypothetical protein
MQRNRNNVSKRLHLPTNLGFEAYFFNEKHALFFSKAFPALWNHVADRIPISWAAYTRERSIMNAFPNLRNNFHMIDELLLKSRFGPPAPVPPRPFPYIPREDQQGGWEREKIREKGWEA